MIAAGLATAGLVAAALLAVALATVRPPLLADAVGRPAGGINVEPSMRPTRYPGPNPDGWWCVQPNCYQGTDPASWINAELTLAHNLGVQVVRVEFPWFLMEPVRGSYDWSRADDIVSAANAHGVQLQPVLVFTPSWEGGPNAPPSAGDWSRFVSTIVGRYKASVHYWEMWNEPDLGTYFNGSELQYVDQVLRPGFTAVKASDPCGQVILGGPSGTNVSAPDWIAAIYQHGGGSSFDIAAYHGYGSNWIGDATSIRAVLRSYGQGSKPIWLGEYGVQENSTADANQQSAIQSILGASSEINVAEWYNLRDDNSVVCCPMALHNSAYWGIVQHDDTTTKTGYAVMKGLLGTHLAGGTCAAQPIGGGSNSGSAATGAQSGVGANTSSGSNTVTASTSRASTTGLQPSEAATGGRPGGAATGPVAAQTGDHRAWWLGGGAALVAAAVLGVGVATRRIRIPFL
jgi:putative glycosyl hydrolase